MAKVKFSGIIEYLDSDFKRIMEDLVDEAKRSDSVNDIDYYNLWLEFKRGINRRFGTWTKVPDRYIKNDN